MDRSYDQKHNQISNQGRTYTKNIEAKHGMIYLLSSANLSIVQCICLSLNMGRGRGSAQHLSDTV